MNFSVLVENIFVSFLEKETHLQFFLYKHDEIKLCDEYFPDPWSLIFAIVNVIARPFSLILLHREMVDRGGSINVSTVYPTTTQRNYEDIDHPKQSVPTNSAAGSGAAPNISNIF